MSRGQFFYEKHKHVWKDGIIIEQNRKYAVNLMTKVIKISFILTQYTEWNFCEPSHYYSNRKFKWIEVPKR